MPSRVRAQRLNQPTTRQDDGGKMMEMRRMFDQLSLEVQNLQRGILKKREKFYEKVTREILRKDHQQLDRWRLEELLTSALGLIFGGSEGIVRKQEHSYRKVNVNPFHGPVDHQQLDHGILEDG
ncbi:hypothetical protein ACH5RR_003252 [Cinchona calisaya]|uniref:Uncharacterized protein n=1 Tax=Cinchona calisaya TaxID=153742 RepID=A0ABD3AUB5_9GENT